MRGLEGFRVPWVRQCSSTGPLWPLGVVDRTAPCRPGRLGLLRRRLLLPAGDLNMTQHPLLLLCSVPDLDRGPQNKLAAEPGLCQHVARNLRLQCLGGHHSAHGQPETALAVGGPAEGGRLWHWPSGGPKLRGGATSRVCGVEGMATCIPATGGLGPWTPHWTGGPRVRGRK